jgi:hypothetical protein
MRLIKQRCKAEAKCIVRCRRTGILCPAIFLGHAAAGPASKHSNFQCFRCFFGNTPIPCGASQWQWWSPVVDTRSAKQQQPWQWWRRSIISFWSIMPWRWHLSYQCTRRTPLFSTKWMLCSPDAIHLNVISIAGTTKGGRQCCGDLQQGS